MPARVVSESAEADRDGSRITAAETGLAGLGLALGLVALAGTAVTLVVALIPSAHVAYRNATLHVALETAIALFGALLSYLAFGRFRQRRALADLVVAYAFGVLAVGNLFFSALAGTVGGLAADQTTTWMLIVARALGAALLAAAAVVGDGRTVARAMPSRAVALGTAGTIGLTVLVLVLVAAWFPDAVRVSLDPDASNRPRFTSSPVAVGVQLLTGLLFLLAAHAFVRRPHRTSDRVPAWLAAGCLLAALASVNYAFFPSLYSRWFYVGDLLRLGAYIAWILGAASEVASYWEERARSAALEERRRLARDIHDGLAQELAFVVTQARELTEDDDDPRLAHLASAAERALDESRYAIATLSTLVDEPPDVAVARAADDVAARTGVRVHLELDTGIALETGVQESLVRIVREAVTNAVRHGRATQVVVRLAAGPSLQLAVSDDGSGFDPGSAARRNDSFGIASMRERAAAIGGTLRIESAPGRGTTVAVTWG